MNCAQCKDNLVAYLEGLLPDSQKQAVGSHLAACPPCRRELQQLENLQDRLNANGKAVGQCSVEATVINRILQEQSLKLKETKTHYDQINLWRIIMKSSITKLAAAAVIIGAVVFLTTVADRTVPMASAAEFLTEAVDAVSNLRSVHIKARIRDFPQDNFQHIELEHDFVPFEIWKSVDQTGTLRWRIEKPLRVAIYDGEFATMLIHDFYAVKGRCPNFQCFDLNNCGHLMNVQGLIERVLKEAQQRKDAELLVYHETINGKEMLVIEIEILARGDFSNDYLKNAFISTSDHRRTYYFNAKTKLLEGFNILVHTDSEDIIVFEITDIEYNIEIAPSIFSLELPENVVWDKEMEILPDNERYAQMTPKEAATAFFQACADEDWEEYLKFDTMSDVPKVMKDFLGGLEIISIGEPFQSGGHRAWFVPYEIKLKNGRVRKHNLALKKDRKTKRWFVDGGI